MKMNQLWSEAKELGIPFKVGMKKVDLIELIEAKKAETPAEEKKLTRKEKADIKESFLNELRADVEVQNILEANTSKSEKIRFLLDEGLDRAIVADLIEVRYQMVYQIAQRHEEAKAKAEKEAVTVTEESAE